MAPVDCFVPHTEPLAGKGTGLKAKGVSSGWLSVRYTFDPLPIDEGKAQVATHETHSGSNDSIDESDCSRPVRFGRSVDGTAVDPAGASAGSLGTAAAIILAGGLTASPPKTRKMSDAPSREPRTDVPECHARPCGASWHLRQRRPAASNAYRSASRSDVPSSGSASVSPPNTSISPLRSAAQ
eukprot:scaffold20725_cov111-Isochrysis_galbana.AAC.16